MDGGIDLALSRVVFPGIEKDVKERIKRIGPTNMLGRSYLPIGSATVLQGAVGSNRWLVVGPNDAVTSASSINPECILGVYGCITSYLLCA